MDNQFLFFKPPNEHLYIYNMYIGCGPPPSNSGKWMQVKVDGWEVDPSNYKPPLSLNEAFFLGGIEGA